MKKTPEPGVGIAEFKARMGRHLRTVRQGGTITLLDRHTAFARIVPVRAEPERLVVREAKGRLQDVKLPPPPSKKIDALAALLEERQNWR